MKIPSDTGSMFKRSRKQNGTGFRDIQINMFREGYGSPPRQWGPIFLAALAVISLVGVFLVYQVQADASDKTDRLQANLENLNRQISGFETGSSEEDEVAKLEKEAKAYENAFQALKDNDEKVLEIVDLLQEVVPDSPDLSVIKLGSSEVTLAGLATDRSSVFTYADALEAQDEFANAHITMIGETTDAGRVKKEKQVEGGAIQITELAEASTSEEEPAEEGSPEINTSIVSEAQQSGETTESTEMSESTGTASVEVGTAPVAAIGMQIMTPPEQEPVRVKFWDASTSYDPIVSWYWDFGDGTTSTASQTFHDYTEEGKYTVTLTVTDSKGRQATTTTGMFDKPVADFTAAVASCDDPLTIQFTDLSTSFGKLLTWDWDFNGDSVIDSTERHPVYTFPEPGVYNVSLTVEGSLRQPATVIKKVTASTPPSADFSVTPLSSQTGLKLKFVDQSTTADQIALWQWDFGDGKTSSEQNPTHTYSSWGPYEVSLRVVEIDGNCSTITKSVSNASGRVADFYAEPAGGNPLQVKFTDQSGIPSGSNASWLWDFGDGSTSTATNPIHTYAAEGKYTVTLRVMEQVSEPDSSEIKYVATSASAQIEISRSSVTPFELVVERKS